MHKRAASPRQPAAVEYTDEQLTVAALGSGLSADELRALLKEHPMSAADLHNAERFAEGVRQGTEPLTPLKL